MCDGTGNCEHLLQAELKRKKSITTYWSVISGLVALLITIVIFYANSLNAMEQVKDHETRIRYVEKTVITTEASLNEINRRLTIIDNKLDRSLSK